MLHGMVESVYSHEVGSKGVINLHQIRGKLHSAKHDTKTSMQAGITGLSEHSAMVERTAYIRVVVGSSPTVPILNFDN